MRTWRRPLMIVAYCVYAVALFAIFAYLTFPSQEARAMVSAALSRYGLERLRLEGVQPLLWAGMALRDVRYMHEVNGEAVELLRLPELRLYLRTLLPFAAPLRLRFEGEVNGGTVLGTIEWRKGGQGATVDLHMHLRDIRPGLHPAVAGKTTVEGRLGGDLALRVPHLAWQDGEGRLTLQGAAGRVAGLEIAGVQLPPVVYEQVSGDVVWQTRAVVVRDFLIRGRDWQFDVQGQLNLTPHWPESALDLTLRVRASETLEQQWGLVGTALKQRRDRRGVSSFRIRGTLGRPSLVL